MTSEPDPAETAKETQAVPPAASAPAAKAATPTMEVGQRSRGRQIVKVVAGFLAVYLLVAYLALPFYWRFYAHRHPSLDDVPGITETSDHHPGDPLNVALIGTKGQLIDIMRAARWHQADALSVRSSIEIAAASVLGRPYVAAPVSNLYLFGRKEDLAFEQPVGDDPRHRHHVRFWKTDKVDWDGRPVWVGSAVYDEHVGLSRTTLQITHVTDANVDAERDYLFKCLQKTGDLTERYAVDNFHKIREGKNGGGDPWHTDGKLYVGVIAPSVK
jgi:hypothetical protein